MCPLGCNVNPNCKNVGAHQANAPATKATHVKPAEESIKLRLDIKRYINNSNINNYKYINSYFNIYFFNNALISFDHAVFDKWTPPSLSPLIGSLTIASNKIIANKPNIGVIRKPHCQAPVVLAASPPIIYPKPLKGKLYVNLYIKFKIIFFFLFIFWQLKHIIILIWIRIKIYLPTGIAK